MSMENVQVVEVNETKLIGYQVTESLNRIIEDRIVGKLREELFEMKNDIPNRLDETGIYLVQIYPKIKWTPDVPFTHFVGFAVSTYDHVPEGLVHHSIPAGNYTKVTHQGPESTIGETYDWLHKKAIAGPRPFDFEYWGDIRTLEQADSAIDIFLPRG
jgi:predicted transcriptional regulator YdeE